MAPLTQSYVHGASPDAPERRDDRPPPAPRRRRRAGSAGARDPPPGRALDICRSPAPLRGPRDRIAGAWTAERRSGRHLVGQRERVGSGAVWNCARRAHPRQHQSRLPRARIRIRNEKVRLPGADPERRPQEQRLFRRPARLRARDRGGPAGQTLVRRPAEARNRHPPGDRQVQGDAQLRRRREARRAGRTGRARDLRSIAAVRRPDQHPVHLRNHRRAEGRDADPPQYRQQRLFHRRSDAPHARTIACAFRCPTITVSAWCSGISPASPTAHAW